MKLCVHVFDLPLRHVFRISRGGFSVQPTVIAELQQDGCSGFGEATANRYYDATVANTRAALEHVAPQLERMTMDTPEALWHALASQLHRTPFAQCALDEAAHDLWGKLHGRPVWQLWGLELDNLPRSSFTIGIDTPEIMVAKLHETPDWPSYKIKLGSDDDLTRIHTLRQHTAAPFRVDANGAWDLPRTLQMAAALRQYNVEFIEQPMVDTAWDDMAQAHAQAALPLIADESCKVASDVARCVEHFHGINIKLMKCGGLTPARQMLAHARQLGLKTMVGCMTESSVGISSLAQLLPLLDYVDMDGAALLQRDIARGVEVVRGAAIFPSRPGCGVELL